MSKPPMTAAGAARLGQQLHKLKTEDRPAIIKAIAEARAHGDLSENAEYHAAREQQGFIEGRINALEAALAAAEIIDVAAIKAEGTVVFGATVEMLNLETDERVRYQIVGAEEADIEQGLISVVSPIARALIGKREGDSIEVQAPGGVKEYELLSIHYGKR